jgi:hypothetical protein
MGSYVFQFHQLHPLSNFSLKFLKDFSQDNINEMMLNKINSDKMIFIKFKLHSLHSKDESNHCIFVIENNSMFDITKFSNQNKIH